MPQANHFWQVVEGLPLEDDALASSLFDEFVEVGDAAES